MKIRKRARLATAIAVSALALAAGFAAPAQATVTQLKAGVNEFGWSNGTSGGGTRMFTFSVSNISTMAAGSMAISVPVSVPVGGWTVSSNQSGATASFTAAQYSEATMTSATGVATVSGVNSHTGVAVMAPVTSAGTATTSPYVFVSHGTGGSATARATTIFGNATLPSTTGWERVKSFEVLWGSVEGSSLLTISSVNGTGYHLSGSDVLDAASKLGIAGGNAGSYYVTVHSNPNLASSYNAYKITGRAAGPNTSMEYVPMSYSTTGTVAVAMPSAIIVPPTTTPPVGAPAPVVGSTPAGGLLALGLLGFLGLGRRRVAAASRLAT